MMNTLYTLDSRIPGCCNVGEWPCISAAALQCYLTAAHPGARAIGQSRRGSLLHTKQWCRRQGAIAFTEVRLQTVTACAHLHFYRMGNKVESGMLLQPVLACPQAQLALQQMMAANKGNHSNSLETWRQLVSLRRNAKTADDIFYLQQQQAQSLMILDTELEHVPVQIKRRIYSERNVYSRQLHMHKTKIAGDIDRAGRS